MIPMSDLPNLAGRAERAEGPDRELDAEIEATQGLIPIGATRCKGGWIIDGHAMASPAYTASLDAALSLVPEGWWADFSTQPNLKTGALEASVHRYVGDDGAEEHTGSAATLPAALTAACLRACAEPGSSGVEGDETMERMHVVTVKFAIWLGEGASIEHETAELGRAIGLLYGDPGPCPDPTHHTPNGEWQIESVGPEQALVSFGKAAALRARAAQDSTNG